MVKLGLSDALAHPGTTVRLEDHVPQQGVVDLLLEHGGDPLQVGHGYDTALAGCAREQREGLVDLVGVRVGRLVARVQLQGADGDEGGVVRVALVVRVKDLGELGQLVFVLWRDVEGSVRKDLSSASSTSPQERQHSSEGWLPRGGGVRVDVDGRGGPRNQRETHIMALRTSSMGMTPSFSPSIGSAKSEKASLISASSCAVMSCSLASLDCLAPALPDAPDSAAPPDFRFGGCFGRECQIDGRLGTCETDILSGWIAWDSPWWASRGASARVRCREVVEM